MEPGKNTRPTGFGRFVTAMYLVVSQPIVHTRVTERLSHLVVLRIEPDRPIIPDQPALRAREARDEEHDTWVEDEPARQRAANSLTLGVGQGDG